MSINGPFSEKIFAGLISLFLGRALITYIGDTMPVSIKILIYLILAIIVFILSRLYFYFKTGKGFEIKLLEEVSHNIHSYIKFIINNANNNAIILNEEIALTAFTAIEKNKFKSKFKINIPEKNNPEKALTIKPNDPITIIANIVDPPKIPLDFLWYKTYAIKLSNGRLKKIRFRTNDIKLSYFKFYKELFLWRRKKYSRDTD